MRSIRPEEAKHIPAPESQPPPKTPAPKGLSQTRDEAPPHRAPALPADLVTKKLSFGRNAEGGPRYLKLEQDGSISITGDRAQKSSRSDVAKALQARVDTGNLGVGEMTNIYRNADALLQKRSVLQKLADRFGLSDRLSNINSLKQAVASEIQKLPQKSISQLRASLGKDVDLPDAWKDALPKILARNQQLIDPLISATKGDPSAFSNAIFGRGLQVAPEEFKILNSLNTTLQDKFAGLTNRQFHTDSIPSLLFERGDAGNVKNKTDRFYANLDQFQQALRGEQTPLYSDLDESTRARLKTQVAAATQSAQQAGFGDLQWFPGNRDPGFLTTHAGWTPESLPTSEKPALLKATRTLGLMMGDHSRIGSVALDLSSLGPLSVEQGKAALILIQDAALEIANRKPVSGFEESPRDIKGEPLFTSQQLQRLKEEATSFATQSHELIDSLHKELSGKGLPPRVGS